MGNKKLKQELFEKVASKLKDALLEISPNNAKDLDKAVKSSAKELSSKLLKKIKKSEKAAKKVSELKKDKAPKVAKAPKAPAPAKKAVKK
jgi:gamma-glutamyl phosphate reductase